MTDKLSPRQAREMDLLEAQAAHRKTIPEPVVDGLRISVSCAPCGLSVDAPNNDFGRTLIAHWPAVHAQDYKPAKVSNP